MILSNLTGYHGEVYVLIMTQKKARELGAEYVQGDLSFRQLAEKPGFTTGQVNDVGSRNKWTRARAVWRSQMMRDALDAPRGNVSIVHDEMQSGGSAAKQQQISSSSEAAATD